ncbi:MAG: hypothetical protein KGL15_02430 [Acidobacteriota bacterium]|nr:hypothetical protein [Acidobacteriota bacterium]
MQAETRVDGFDRALQGIPSCALDGDARRLQKARYQRVAGAITKVVREPHAVRVEFDAAVDTSTIRELVVAEQDCCPFLNLDWDDRALELSVTVASETMLPALAAIAAAFSQAREKVR